MKNILTAAFVAAILFLGAPAAHANPGYGGHHNHRGGGQSYTVYAYDVYYYGYNQYSGRHEWVRYGSYWDMSDARRVERHVRHQYRAATQVVSRPWRTSRNY